MCLVSSLGDIISKTMGASGTNPPSAGVEGGVGGCTGVASDAVESLCKENALSFPGGREGS